MSTQADTSNTPASEQSSGDTAVMVQPATVQITRRNPTPSGLIPWQKGQSGNPKGRPAAGMVVMEQVDRMIGWTRDEVKAVLDNPASPLNQVNAARWLLDAATQDRTKGGTPVASPELQHLLDRTIGKPVQQVQSVSTSVRFSFDLGAMDSQDEATDAVEGGARPGQIEDVRVVDSTQLTGSVQDDTQGQQPQ